jgi:hypothetical protein
MGPVPILFRCFVDDAALFPPGNAPMAAAVPAHRRLRDGPTDPLVGPFLCPASRLTELRTQLGDDDRLDLGIVVDTGVESIEDLVSEASDDPRITLEMLEAPVPPGTDMAVGAERVVAAAFGSPRLFVELPREPGWLDALEVVGRAGRGAKLRTGGARADLFPSDEELAGFISACATRRVPFKCTAGLHHAIRHTDPATGFRHHGFLNIIVATARAVIGGDVPDAVAEPQAERLAAEAAGLGADHARLTRALFASYGSCDIDEPLDDLRSLGLLPVTTDV